MKKLKRLLAVLLVCSICFTNQAYSFASSQDEESISMEIGDDENEDEYNIEDSYKVSFNIESQWNDQYSGKIVIKNVSNESIENWKISFVTKDEIENIWCAKIEEHNDDTYIIKNVEWNQDIRPGEEVSFGFIAKCDGTYDEPHNFYMSQVCAKVELDYTIDYNITSEWENGLNAQINITNNSDKIIEDWRLLFNSNLKIERFWTAKISHREAEKYYIQNMGYNANISPGQTISLGFNAVKVDNEKIDLNGFELYCMESYKEDTKDSDNDGVYDNVELSLGTDPNNKDSDNDGLDDLYEVNILGTDPIKVDSDSNGINDGDEDSDNDGISNIEEYNIGTDPLNEDTDDDRLSDKEEKEVYGTDPLNEDTDSDDVDDYVEIQLGLNPLNKDTDSNGTSDSEEMILQTVDTELEDNTVITGMSISMETNEYLEDDLFIDTGIEDNLTANGIIDNMVYIDSELIDMNKPASISFKYNKETIPCDPKELIVYEYIGDRFVKLDTNIDEKNMSVNIYTPSLRSIYYVGIEGKDNNSNVAYLKNNTPYTKKRLARDIRKLFEKEKLNPLNVRIYTIEEAIDIIDKYDSKTSAISKQYGIKKEMIQSVLIRELICLSITDIPADMAVENYYHNQEELERYFSMSWWQQLLYGTPQYLFPTSEDSTTGIGQIFAGTAISAREYNLKPGEKHYYYSNWKQRRKVWYSLKDNDKYSISMVGKILKKNAAEKSIKNPSKKTFQEVVALYNASTVKRGLAYGKMLYKYSKFLEKYNKNNN